MSRTPKKKHDPDAPDRIWFEIEWPVGCGDRIDEVAERRAAAATKLLRKLGDDTSEFWWHKTKQTYCFSFSKPGGFTELVDRGQWLNLTFMAE